MRILIMMRGITLYEPWASLMAIGAKTQETRPMRTNHRGDICIHAAVKKVYAILQDVLNAFRNRAEPIKFQYGHIIAVVDLWDVQPSERFISKESSDPFFITISNEEKAFGNYDSGRWIYRTRNLRRLKTPIPCKGFQCVGWTVPANVEKEVLKQLSEF